jgi:hypothetical protein
VTGNFTSRIWNDDRYLDYNNLDQKKKPPNQAASLLLATTLSVIQNVAAWGPANRVRGVSGVKDLLFVMFAPAADIMIHSDLPKWD